MTQNATLRKMCRGYLQRLRRHASKHGLTQWLNQAIEDTKRQDCSPTEQEVMLLSRAVDDERLQRTEVPPLLGKNYMECFVDEDFEKIKKLKRVGIYSKVSTLLYADKIRSAEKQTKVKSANKS